MLPRERAWRARRSGSSLIDSYLQTTTRLSQRHGWDRRQHGARGAGQCGRRRHRRGSAVRTTRTRAVVAEEMEDRADSGAIRGTTNLSTGGEGGSPFPATIDRIAMGGGGGRGNAEQYSDGDNQASGGAAGGGIIFIRADSLTGTATLTANGMNAYNGTPNDAGGGGGAGGSIIVLAANGGESGLTLQANGGRGGDAWDSDTYSLADRHGPGGGGAGGVVLVSGAAASISVTGGGNGTTLTPGVAYGATPGAAGTSATNATLSQVTGLQSSSVCVPDLTITKSQFGKLYARIDCQLHDYGFKRERAAAQRSEWSRSMTRCRLA